MVCRDAFPFPPNMNMCFKSVSWDSLWLDFIETILSCFFTLHITFLGAPSTFRDAHIGYWIHSIMVMLMYFERDLIVCVAIGSFTPYSLIPDWTVSRKQIYLMVTYSWLINPHFSFLWLSVPNTRPKISSVHVPYFFLLLLFNCDLYSQCISPPTVLPCNHV